MKWLFIICLILNAMTQGSNIDDLSAKISTLNNEKNTMKIIIKQLEEDVYMLERRKK